MERRLTSDSDSEPDGGMEDQYKGLNVLILRRSRVGLESFDIVIFKGNGNGRIAQPSKLVR